MRNPSARAVEAAATEEILRRLETEVDKRFQDVATKHIMLRIPVNGALWPPPRVPYVKKDAKKHANMCNYD